MADRFTMIPDAVMDRLMQQQPIAVKPYLYLRRARNRRTRRLDPSIETIADMTHLDRKTVYAALRVLEAAGLIARKRTNRSNHYELIDAPADIPSDGTSSGLFDIPRNGTSTDSDIPPDGTPGCTAGRDARMYRRTGHKPYEGTRRRNQKKNPSDSPAAVAAKPTRSRDGIWDALIAAFGMNPITKTEQSRVGKIVSDLTVKGATPDDIPIRLQRYRSAWPNAADTPEALLKHWDRFGTDTPRNGDSRNGQQHRTPQRRGECPEPDRPLPIIRD